MMLDLCSECNLTEAKYQCSGCHKVKYCSQKCQINNWNNHKSSCKQHRKKN